MLVKIRNFQSLRSVDLEIAGFTVITGSSNVGKSAVVRSISAAIFGELGDYYISDRPDPPADQCAVAIIEQNSHVKWWKVRDGKATPQRSTSLEVWDGTKTNKYTKFGKEQAELTKDLGFLTMRVADKEICPQIAMQLDEIFLLQRSETEAAEVLKLLGRVDVVTEAQRLATKDAREVAGKLKIRGSDQLEAKIRLEALEWVPKKRYDLNHLFIVCDCVITSNEGREKVIGWVKEVQSIKMKKSIPGMLEKLVPMGYLRKIEQIKELRQMGIVRTLTKQREEIKIPIGKMELVKKIEEARQLSSIIVRDGEMRKVCENLMNVAKNEKEIMEKELGKCPTCERMF